MDAGVKLRKPVSGIAMGLISDSESGKWAVLSDILGDEDHLGDMDFKVTGTRDGITATQMDIKVDGLSYEVLAAALEQARKGRLHILDILTDCIAAPRADYKPFVPRLVQIHIPKDSIGAVIGPGGKVIQEIQKTTGTTITITEKDSKGFVDIFGENKEALDAALDRIKGIVAIPEVGEIYTGKIRSIVAFGAFVEIMPGKDGLLHISQIRNLANGERIDAVEDVLKEGDTVEVIVQGVDDRGKISLAIPGFEDQENNARPSRGDRDDRRGGRGRGDRDDRRGGRGRRSERDDRDFDDRDDRPRRRRSDDFEDDYDDRPRRRRSDDRDFDRDDRDDDRPRRRRSADRDFDDRDDRDARDSRDDDRPRRRRSSDRDDRGDRDDRRGGSRGRGRGSDRNPRYATDDNYDDYRADREERTERPRRRVRRDFDPFED